MAANRSHTGASWTATTVPEIDRGKLRERLRKIGNEYIFYMLDDAIDLLSPAQLARLVSPYINVKQLAPDPALASEKRTLLSNVRNFDARSRAGYYYQSFDVNSKNCTETSPGTRSFIADCRRLLDRAVDETTRGDPAEVRASFELIFNLLRYIDECHDDVIFFADEGGAWQIGINWTKVFPAWFRCLSQTADAEEYARLIIEAVDEFESFARETHFATARNVGTTAQQRALETAVKAVQERGR